MLFWVIALYVAALGSYSVVAQVFNIAPGPEDATPECGRQMGELKNNLLQRAAHVVTDYAEAGDDDAWFATWDARYERFSDACEALTHSRLQLRALRQRLETWLARYRREHLPLVQRIDERIDELVAPPPTPPRDM